MSNIPKIPKTNIEPIWTTSTILRWLSTQEDGHINIHYSPSTGDWDFTIYRPNFDFSPELEGVENTEGDEQYE